MEQPTSNPRFCTNNCGFYGSPQFEGMCSKCYRDHVSRSFNNSGRNNSFSRFYGSSNSSVTPTSQTQTVLPSTSNSSDVADQPSIHDDQDEVVGRMDEDNVVTESTNNEVTVKIFNDEPNNEDDDIINQNSESSVTMEETTKNDSNLDETTPSNDTNITGASASIPMTISRNIDIPTKNESTTSLSVMETSSLAESMSPMMASSVDKKKRNRCSWQSCNKKLGLTGFDCRCGGQFCPLHRYANEHNCTFDYKEHGQIEIRKNMPVVQAPRIRPI